MNTKGKYIEVLKQKVKSVDIVQIAHLRYDLVKQGHYYKMLCPFHGDESIGSFVVGGRQNTYHCFTCGENGDGIHLIQQADGTGFVDTIINISQELKFITSDQANSLLHDNSGNLNVSDISEGDYHPFEATDSVDSNIAEADVLHNVFTSFAKGNSLVGENRLKKDHYNHLKSVRGLSDEVIEAVGFFTFPNPKVLKTFYDELYTEYGYLPTILENVPGFYSATKWKVDTKQANCTFSHVMDELTVQLFDKQDGIGMPVRDAQGRIVGIQIRQEEGNMRYSWFSSSKADRQEGKANPTSSGAPKDVVYPSQLKNTTLFITEGKFKALKLAQTFGSVVISIQGVSSWRGIENLILEIEEEKDMSFNHIVIAYDADLAFNDAVAKQSLNLGDALSDITNATVHVAIWNDDLGKGIDDLIENGNMHHLRRIEFQTFKLQITPLIKEIELFKKRFPKERFPKEKVKASFLTNVLEPVAIKS